MTRRLWFSVVPLLALLAFALRPTQVLRSPVPAVVASSPTSHEVARTAAVPRSAQPSSTPGRRVTSDADPVLAPHDEDGEGAESRARLLASPVFSHLPPPDQHWVLVQARARVQGPDDPRLEQVVHELSEVRLFAVSEREEPLAPLEPSR
jgi:hypothetical protein